MERGIKRTHDDTNDTSPVKRKVTMPSPNRTESISDDDEDEDNCERQFTDDSLDFDNLDSLLQFFEEKLQCFLDENELSEHISDEVRSVRDFIKQERSEIDFKPTICLLGKSGVGKSFIMNMILMLTMVDSATYRVNAKKCLRLEYKDDFTGNNVEMLQPQNDTNYRKNPKPDKTLSLIQKCCEEDYYLNTSTVDEDNERLFRPFIVPSSRPAAGSTTQFPIYFDYGDIFHAILVFRPRKNAVGSVVSCIGDLFNGFNDDTESETCEVEVKRVVKNATIVAKALLDISGDDEDEDIEEDLEWLPEHFRSYPSPWDTHRYDDIIESHIGKTLCFCGDGKSPNDDREYVASKIAYYTSHPRLRVLLEAVHVYVPSRILRDCRYVDPPGCCDQDSFNEKYLDDAMNSSDIVLAIDSSTDCYRSPLADDMSKERYGKEFFTKRANDPSRYMFYWIKYDEKSEHPTAMNLLQDETNLNRLKREHETFVNGNMKALKGVFKTQRRQYVRGQELNDEVDRIMREGIYTYPLQILLFSSLLTSIDGRKNLASRYGTDRVSDLIDFTNGERFIRIGLLYQHGLRKTTMTRVKERIRMGLCRAENVLQGIQDGTIGHQNRSPLYDSIISVANLFQTTLRQYKKNKEGRERLKEKLNAPQWELRVACRGVMRITSGNSSPSLLSGSEISEIVSEVSRVANSLSPQSLRIETDPAKMRRKLNLQAIIFSDDIMHRIGDYLRELLDKILVALEHWTDNIRATLGKNMANLFVVHHSGQHHTRSSAQTSDNNEIATAIREQFDDFWRLGTPSLDISIKNIFKKKRAHQAKHEDNLMKVVYAFKRDFVEKILSLVCEDPRSHGQTTCKAHVVDLLRERTKESLEGLECDLQAYLETFFRNP